MTDETCSCTHEPAREGSSDSQSESASTNGTVYDESTVNATLPEELQTTLEQFVDASSISTISDWATIVREETEGDALRVEQICHTDEPSGHKGVMDGETYHFHCFYDAVILAALAEKPVDIVTKSPAGETIAASATNGDLSVDNPEAVFSFGIAPEAANQTGELELEDAYSLMCPYVRAFPNEDSYREWANQVDGPTVAMPLDNATELAEALAE